MIHESEMATANIDEVVTQYTLSFDLPSPIDAAELCRLRPDLTELKNRLRIALLVHDALAEAARAPIESKVETGSLTVEDEFANCFPRSLGPYQLLNAVGEGTFGVVFRGTRQGGNGVYAIKLLRKSLGLDAGIVERFRREARIGNERAHSGIVSVVDAGDVDGWHYLVMPFIQGLDLRRLTLCGLLGPDDAVRIVSTVSRTIADLHAWHTIHRDLKPENILLSVTGEILITDFGLAKELDAQTMLTLGGPPIGTPEYMAPENFDGLFGNVDHRSDLYSLGATLHFLLSGAPPFPRPPDANVAAHVRQCIRESASPLTRFGKTLPHDLRIIRDNCMERFPEDRYNNATELAEDLDRYLAGKRVRRRRISYRKRAHNYWRRSPLASGVIMTLIGLLIGGGIYGGYSLAGARAATRQSFKLGHIREYATDMQEIQERWEAGQRNKLPELLSKYEDPRGFDPRGFEWYYWRRVTSEPKPLRIDPKGATWHRPIFDTAGGHLALIDRTGFVTILDTQSGKQLFEIVTPTCNLVFSQDGRYCITLKAERFAGCEIRDATDGHLLRTFGVGEEITAIAIHSDGRLFCTGDADGHVRAWDLGADRLSPISSPIFDDHWEKDPESPVTIPFTPSDEEEIRAESSGVSELAFSSARDVLYTGFYNGRIKMWRLQSMEARTTHEEAIDKWFKTEPYCIVFGLKHSGPITGFAHHPYRDISATQSFGAIHNNRLDFNTGEVKIWNQLNVVRRTFSPHASLLNETHLLSPDPTIAVRFGCQQPIFGETGLIYTTGDHGVQVWDLESGIPPIDLPGSGRPVVGLAFEPTRGLLADVDMDGWVQIQPIPDRIEQVVKRRDWQGRPYFGLSVSPDGQRIAVVTEKYVMSALDRDGMRSKRSNIRDVEVIDLSSGSTLFIGNGRESPRRPPQFVENGDAIVFNGQHFDVSNLKSLTDATKVKLRTTGFDECRSDQAEYTIVRVPFGSQVGELWRPNTSNPFATLGGHKSEITSFTVSRDGLKIATGDRAGMIYLWSGETGLLLHSISHQSAITAMSFDPEGLRVATGDDDGLVQVWQVPTGQLLSALPGHKREVTAIEFLRGGTRLVTSSGRPTPGRLAPGDVLVWDLNVNQRVLRLAMRRPSLYSGLAVSSDGTGIYASVNAVATSAGGLIVLWDCVEALKVKVPSPGD